MPEIIILDDDAREIYRAPISGVLAETIRDFLYRHGGVLRTVAAAARLLGYSEGAERRRPVLPVYTPPGRRRGRA